MNNMVVTEPVTSTASTDHAHTSLMNTPLSSRHSQRASAAGRGVEGEGLLVTLVTTLMHVQLGQRVGGRGCGSGWPLEEKNCTSEVLIDKPVDLYVPACNDTNIVISTMAAA